MFSENNGLVLRGDHGAVTTELLTIGAGGPTIGRVISTGHEIALREADNMTFLMPRAGRLDIRIGQREFRLASGQLMMFRPTERRSRSSAGPDGRFHAATLQVPKDRVKTLAESAEASADRAFKGDGITLQGEVGLLMARSLPQLADDLFLLPSLALPQRIAVAIGHMIDELLCAVIGGTVAQSALRRVLPAFHRVRQAEEIMHEESDEPLSMLQIAERLGVGLRSLQLAFNEVHGGQSPRDILSRIRLDRARQRLLAANGDGQVTTVAMDSGFFHLGRFAQAYARAYGERPSETLARRRA